MLLYVHPSNFPLATNITKVGNNGAPAEDLRRHFQTKLKRVSLNQNELDPLEIITPERPYYTCNIPIRQKFEQNYTSNKEITRVSLS